MMRGLTLMKSLPITQVAINNGDGAEFILTPDPKEVAQAGGTTGFAIYLDLGAVAEFDTVFVGFTNAAPGAHWYVDRTSSLDGSQAVRVLPENTPFSVPGTVGSPKHGLAYLPATVSRYLRMVIHQPAGSQPLRVGIVMIGKRFEKAYEFKSGRRPIDLSERVDLASGGFGFGRGAIKSSFRFTFADLQDDELETLWRIITDVGIQRPALLIEGGTDTIQAPQVHYGVFERFEPYERDDPAETRWALSLMDWI